MDRGKGGDRQTSQGWGRQQLSQTGLGWILVTEPKCSSKHLAQKITDASSLSFMSVLDKNVNKGEFEANKAGLDGATARSSALLPFLDLWWWSRFLVDPPLHRRLAPPHLSAEGCFWKGAFHATRTRVDQSGEDIDESCTGGVS